MLADSTLHLEKIEVQKILEGQDYVLENMRFDKSKISFRNKKKMDKQILMDIELQEKKELFEVLENEKNELYKMDKYEERVKRLKKNMEQFLDSINLTLGYLFTNRIEVFLK